ncbi:hypothetical protein DOS86_01145 [Anaplasma marginale]|nr:hypothetical protein AM1216 [Anaplasma marginale str. St. Maries]RCL20032.1 hypothetical protein DOS86_01145 [Anaplasma marginale]
MRASQEPAYTPTLPTCQPAVLACAGAIIALFQCCCGRRQWTQVRCVTSACRAFYVILARRQHANLLTFTILCGETLECCCPWLPADSGVVAVDAEFLHKRKIKNCTVFALLLALVVVLFFVSIVRVKF